MSNNSSSKLNPGEGWFDGIILIASLVVLVLAYRISGFSISAAGTFPMASSAVMVGSMLMVLWGNRSKATGGYGSSFNELRQALKTVFTKDFIVFVVLSTLYILSIESLHFVPTSFVFIAVSIIYLKGSSPLKAFLISSITLTFIYLIFLYFFKVLLP